MKNAIFKTMFFLLFALLSLMVKAQNNDYVITMKGDTIRCHINKPLFGGYGNYQTDTLSGEIKIKPTTIKEYYMQRRKLLQHAVYKSFDGKPLFMDVIEIGKINLFYVVNTSYSGNGAGSSTTDWYIAKGSDTVKALKTNSLFSSKSRSERKDEFAEMIKDNTAVYDKYIADNKFSFKEIERLVHLYNTGQDLK